MPGALPGQLKDLVRPRINRAPSPVLAMALPWILVMFGSLSPAWPVISSAPVMPPLGFLFLLGWLHLRPGLLPVWAGLPLGLFDDLYSGMPFGSGIVLWSGTMLAMELIDEKFLWRGFVQDWLAASALIAAYLFIASLLAGLATGYPLPLVILPQTLVSVVLYPVVSRLVALLDRVRLLPLKRL